MGRVFCLPLFGRKNKMKFEYQSATSDESYVATPVSRSPASQLEMKIEPQQQQQKVDREVPLVKQDKAEDVFSNEDHMGVVAQGSMVENVLSDSQTSEVVRTEIAYAGGPPYSESPTSLTPIEAPQEEEEEEAAAMEPEVLTGHLSDPGFYYVEDRGKFSESSETSDCSNNAACEETDDAKFDMCHLVIPMPGEIPVGEDYHRLQDDVQEEKAEAEEQRAATIADISTFAAAEEKADHDGYDEYDGGGGGGASGLNRVEEWVRSIELVSDLPPIEMLVGESSATPAGGHNVPPPRTNHRDMELAIAVTRSLDFHSSVAQLSGIGLTVMPCLGVFTHLKTLKLSGNSIVKITPGSLPKGLHSLDLSKNKISVIEGLRELTRLRTLNLSHNRISRIGQGLANCSSIRELYLACNKISEVEGLHRLTKLACLDLSFNKLSSTKSLGQIAASYTSLMAVNLVGNPVLVNVGEEQVKRFITGLAPNLVFLNKQPVKGGASTRDAVARSLLASSSSASRHTPHNLTGGSSSKMKRMINSNTTNSSSNITNKTTTNSLHRRKDRDSRGGSNQNHRQNHLFHQRPATHHAASSSSSRLDFESDIVKERLLARIHGNSSMMIQRVRSDGALHDRDG